MSDHVLGLLELGSVLVLSAPEADCEGDIHAGMGCVAEIIDLRGDRSSRIPLPSEEKVLLKPLLYLNATWVLYRSLG
jgi:hypothetical protein